MYKMSLSELLSNVDIVLFWSLGYVTRMGMIENEYMFVGKPEGKKAVGICKRRWERSIKSPLSLS
jgi:hypothetical protein